MIFWRVDFTLQFSQQDYSIGDQEYKFPLIPVLLSCFQKLLIFLSQVLSQLSGDNWADIRELRFVSEIRQTKYLVLYFKLSGGYCTSI